ncbi:MAG: hypothetical protein M3083_03210 [Actinomycetota bacterium]|nr:hypothetical protein [Actinomycetota bacterium]MDQ6948360.1 hypothetical protein [Actinomycetota bacterium]
MAELLLFDAAEAAEHGNTAYLESALSHHAGLAGQIIAAEARTSAGPGVAVPEPWGAQLEQVAAGASAPDWADPEQLRDGASLMGMLTHLPLLPCFATTPIGVGPGAQGNGEHAAARQ